MPLQNGALNLNFQKKQPQTRSWNGQNRTVATACHRCRAADVDDFGIEIRRFSGATYERSEEDQTQRFQRALDLQIVVEELVRRVFEHAESDELLKVLDDRRKVRFWLDGKLLDDDFLIVLRKICEKIANCRKSSF